MSKFHNKLAVEKAIVSYFQGNIARHQMNVNVMLNNPMGIHEHTDYIGAIEKELEAIAEYEDKLAVWKKLFPTTAADMEKDVD